MPTTVMPTVRHTQIHTLISFPDYYHLYHVICMQIANFIFPAITWIFCEWHWIRVHTLDIMKGSVDVFKDNALPSNETFTAVVFHSLFRISKRRRDCFCSTLQNCQALKLYNTSAEIEEQQFQDSGTLWWCVISHHIGCESACVYVYFVFILMALVTM